MAMFVTVPCSMGMRMRMRRIDPMHRLRLLDRLNIRQIYSNCLAIASHEHTLQLLVRRSIDLLMRHYIHRQHNF